MIERAFSPIYEISSENKVAGRRPIKVVLHEIFPDDTRWQENGISWKETYVLNNLHSVSGMSIVVEFLTDERDIPYAHGMTEIRSTDNLPLFEDATMVGHFDRAYVDDVEIEGVKKRVLIAEGTLDEMRYPKFVAWLREHMEKGVVKGSVEIVGKAEHDGHIIYSGGWKEQGRVPQIYDYSGYAILSVTPADEAAIVMELNNKTEQKEDSDMDEKMKNDLMAVISGAMTETNAKMEQVIAQLNAKETEINQLRADIETANAAKTQAETDLAEANAAKEAAETSLAEANAAKEAAEASLAEANAKITQMEGENAKAELNAALAPYSEEQRAIAKDEIEAFNANPGSVEINTIVGKICTEMVRVSLEAHTAETNAASKIDVFGMTEDTPPAATDDSDVDVF